MPLSTVYDFISFIKIKISATASADAADYPAAATASGKARRAIRQAMWFSTIKGGLLADAVLLKAKLSIKEAQALLRALYKVWTGAMEDAVYGMLDWPASAEALNLSVIRKLMLRVSADQVRRFPVLGHAVHDRCGARASSSDCQ